MERYETPHVHVSGGRYADLVLGPPSINYYGLEITFHIVINGVESQAEETDTFKARSVLDSFISQDLTFPGS